VKNNADMSTLTRKEIDRQRREEDFLSAAERLFAQKGYHNTSIEDIAVEAQYGTGTVYRYFETKEELYAVLMERKSREYLGFLKKQVAAAHAPMDKIRSLVSGKIDFFVRNKEFFRIYAAEGATLRWTFRDRFQEQLKGVYQEYQAFHQETFSACMKPGGLRRMDAAMMASVFSGMTNHLLLEALNNETADALEQARAFLLELVERGFAHPGQPSGS